MLRVMLVDDEPLARRGLRQLLANHSDLEIVGEAATVTAASEILAEQKPQAVFLDVRMPGGSGFDLIQGTGEDPKVIFVTAHSEHAARAFEVQAVDYLLKPVRPERLAKAVERLKAVCEGREEAPGYQQDEPICLRTPERTVVTPPGEIAAIQADGDFSRFFLIGQPSLLICRSLLSWEKTLPSPPFLRVSRSLLVNVRRVLSITEKSRDHGLLRLEGMHEEFELGRAALGRLKQKFRPK